MNQQRELTDHEIDEHAQHLAELPGIRCVADVRALAPKVEGVWASGLTDAMLARLAEQVSGLRILASDGNSHITDAGLGALRRFTRLESLDLEWSAVSDAGLPLIAAVSTLKWVDVGGSKGVTAVGLAGLRAARPDLAVEPQDI